MAYENIIFCWVMCEQAMIDEIVLRLEIVDCRIYKISPECSIEEFSGRIRKDEDAGIRLEDVIQRSSTRAYAL